MQIQPPKENKIFHEELSPESFIADSLTEHFQLIRYPKLLENIYLNLRPLN